MRNTPISGKTLLVFLLVAAIILPFLKSCGSDDPKKNTDMTDNNNAPKPAIQQVPVPAFSGDSAYAFVKKQVDFGPRVPNTEAHRKCAKWMAGEFRRFGMTVIEQPVTATHYKGNELKGVNIIAQYKPELPQRILLAAHWDSRFIADQDTKNQNMPILGADDGGSGIGILLELARTLQNNPVDIGVDLICFDLEDQGSDADDGEDHSHTWCLGSQYWSQNLHQASYSPQFGILLDMVGAADAKFPKEGISRQAAPLIVDKVWELAAKLGHGNVFLQKDGQGITDDHLFVIQNARIPMIDVINRPEMTKSGFVSHWHTHNDNMKAIDKKTLQIVGDVMTAVVYQMHNGVFL